MTLEDIKISKRKKRVDRIGKSIGTNFNENFLALSLSMIIHSGSSIGNLFEIHMYDLGSKEER